ncbi:hypothetical protein RJ640_016624 [Escallonia rubra]|uniref:RNase H type-1 domain-containing protein n=1 Tax=Escallonia rubra TaxID=112253 RepID=A0AA88RJJ9_9ASTE|nr:hypothetical protein RJ640_016624 [Escallonia rubra]
MRVEQLPPRKVTLVQWHPPSPGFLKLNTDGSAFGQPGPASYGGLIRGEKGEWICGYAGNIGIRTSLTAEICCIYKGLCLIREKNMCRVMIETYCMAAINLVSREKVDDKHPMKRILDKCREIMASCGCFMVHTVREGNFCADMLAKLGHRLQSDYIELRDPPIEPWVAPSWTPSRTPSLPYYGGVSHRRMPKEQPPTRKVTLVQWHPPSPGFLKLKTDGSAFGQPGPASYGGLIRGEKREWICGYAGNIGIHTSLTAEICGIYKGLCLIREKNLRRVMVETSAEK